MKKRTTAPVPVLLRLPPPLLKKLDKASSEQGRSRTAEACMRLAASFKAAKVERAEP